MTARPVIIDCDPGQDDAIMLLLSMASPDELDILGITTVAGNVPLALTSRNARILCDLAGKQGMGVYAGCSRPLVRPLVTAEEVHGKTGIDGIEITEPATPLQSRHAVDFIVETLSAAEDNAITLLPIGPLTNIAAALIKAPAIAGKIREIVLMGGAMREGGNTTPSAEFNIYVDPHAADVVFRCGRPIVVMGLDVTHQVLTTQARSKRIQDLGNPVAQAAHNMLAFFDRHDVQKYGSDGAPLHDPCTTAYLLKPELFKTKACNLQVEIHSELTMGHTAVDFWHVTDRPKNVEWVYGVDSDGFFDLLTERLGRY
ncbi:nucleoside hydrolase [Denitrobaculum tricleocarpae]|uniref:Nucleoside hydrolase n=1 Tax=Denitrobaculum tricleocarpae TaxID=2591009 RepID=A0A545TY29_9PROT|nr:nucleoside hydrolase [Denitrobaculum tricleocarpae]TQV82123.1 nucleoside hydrolase [Denitrobaculum tricleocarpae]